MVYGEVLKEGSSDMRAPWVRLQNPERKGVI